MRIRRLVFSAVLVSSIFFACRNAAAQGTNLGTIRGTVTDVSGAVVPNAQVEVVDLETNTPRTVTTNAEGNYELVGLKYGSYKVSISAPGFSKAEISGITLRGGDAARADTQLKPAAQAESVVITSEAPQITTDSPVIRGTLDNKALTELPRDSRDIYSFLYLNPNVTQGTTDGAFKFLGAQSYGASFSLDGQRSNGGVFGEPTLAQPSLEAVGEFVVMSNDFTAEYAGIANIRVETKRGEAQYHGTAFYNNKNSDLAAWDIKDKAGQANFLPNAFQSSYPNPYFNINEIGASFGGPVPKLKQTYFFMAYERRWTANPIQVYNTRLPHPSLWGGDFSAVDDSIKPAVPAGITLTSAEITNDTVGGLGQQFTRIPQRLLNPVTQAFIQDYFPKISTGYAIDPATGRLPAYFNLAPHHNVRDLGTVRLDHDFSERDRIYAVYNVQPNNGDSGSLVVAPFSGLGLTQSSIMDQTLSISEIHQFGPRVINEARGGFNRENSFRHSNQTLRDFLSNIGFDQSDIAAYGAVVGPTLDTQGHPAVNFGSNFQEFSNGGRNTYRPLVQKLLTFGDTLTWVVGRHTIKGGGDVVRNYAVDGFTANRGNPRGRIVYSGTGTSPFANFLLGLPPNSVQYVDALRGPMHIHNWEQGYFAQDDIQVNKRLTVNLGVRYELINPFIEENNLLVNFDPSYVNATTGQKGRFVVPTQATIAQIDPRMVQFGVATASQLGLPRALVKTDRTDIAPRVGAAFRINDSTVLRGGYGMYYPTSAAQGMRDAMATNPFNQGRTKTTSATGGPPLDGWPGFSHGFSPMTGGTVSTVGGTPSINTIPFDLKNPRIHQFNVTFERQLPWQTAVRASYLGTRMRRLITGRDMNMLAPSDTPFATTTGDGVTVCDPNEGNCDYSPADLARQPFPGLGDYLASYQNFGHGRSDAMQLEVKRRFASGLFFQADYTLLQQKSSAVDSGNSTLGGTAYNQFQPEHDYAIDSYVPRHRFIAYGIAELPVGRGKKFGSNLPALLDHIIGGWQTSFQIFAKSGTGFTPFWVCDNCYNGAPVFPGNIGSGFVDAIGDFSWGGSFRPIVVGNAAKPKGDRLWDPSAFTVPTVGADVFDNPKVAKRNSLMGPGTYGVNLGIHKVFQLGEKVRADLGADFDNIFNHPLFSPSQDGENISQLGDFNIALDPATRKILPITDITPNPDFGRLINSYTQENVDSRRTTRLKLRIIF